MLGLRGGSHTGRGPRRNGSAVVGLSTPVAIYEEGEPLVRFGLGADAEATEFVQAELKWLREELSLSNGNEVDPERKDGKRRGAK